MMAAKGHADVLADVGEPAAMERDAILPKRRNGVLGDAQGRGICATALRMGSPQEVVR